jgi:hypothetical protein
MQATQSIFQPFGIVYMMISLVSGITFGYAGIKYIRSKNLNIVLSPIYMLTCAYVSLVFGFLFTMIVPLLLVSMMVLNDDFKLAFILKPNETYNFSFNNQTTQVEDNITTLVVDNKEVSNFDNNSDSTSEGDDMSISESSTTSEEKEECNDECTCENERCDTNCDNKKNTENMINSLLKTNPKFLFNNVESILSKVLGVPSNDIKSVFQSTEIKLEEATPLLNESSTESKIEDSPERTVDEELVPSSLDDKTKEKSNNELLKEELTNIQSTVSNEENH